MSKLYDIDAPDDELAAIHSLREELTREVWRRVQRHGHCVVTCGDRELGAWELMPGGGLRWLEPGQYVFVEPAPIREKLLRQ